MDQIAELNLMVTLAQLQAAHRKVKSGADFPAYIQEIKQLGVSAYATFVADGHVEFMIKEDGSITSGPKYGALKVEGQYEDEQFKAALKIHQQGQTDYPTFCSDSARFGVEKWVVDTEKMTCTYYNSAGDNVLVEIIPS